VQALYEMIADIDSKVNTGIEEKDGPIDKNNEPGVFSLQYIDI
jgi:hypothetical protein